MKTSKANMLISLIILSSSMQLKAQTNLNAGDLAIVEYNADNPDRFAFVLLTGIDSGTLIKFTDRGWLDSGAFRTGEGVLNWTADRAYNCSEVVHVDSVGAIAFSVGGDQLLVYQGADSSPVFITAFNNNGSASWQSTASSTSTSALPASLTNGSNAVAVFEKDNVLYNGMVSGNMADINAELFDSSKFIGNDTSAVNFNSTFSISGACFLPVNLISFEVTGNSNSRELIWATAQEVNNSHFSLERSTNNVEFASIALIPGAGNSSDVLHYRFLDNDRILGQVYYRLKQTDYDGSVNYSGIITLSENMPFVLIRNEGFIQLKYEGKASVSLYSMEGIKLYEAEAAEGMIIPEIQSSGIVLLYFRSRYKQVIRKVLIY